MGKDFQNIFVEITAYPIWLEGEDLILAIVRDTSQKKYFEKIIDKLEKEKIEILDHSPILIIYHDLEHKIIWANQTACHSAGKRLEELKGKKCYRIWAARNLPCEGCPVERAWIKNQVISGEMMTSHNHYLQVTGIPFTDDQGQIIGAIETAVDITELKLSRQKMEKR